MAKSPRLPEPILGAFRRVQPQDDRDPRAQVEWSHPGGKTSVQLGTPTKKGCWNSWMAQGMLGCWD